MKICLQCGKDNPDHYETCMKCDTLLRKEDIGQILPIKDSNKQEV
jgi:hypothetical protein